MFSVQKGQRVRVNGFLQSREFKEGLLDLVEKARKNGHIEIKLPEDSGLEKVTIERNTTEVVATRVISLDTQPKKKTHAQ